MVKVAVQKLVEYNSETFQSYTTLLFLIAESDRIELDLKNIVIVTWHVIQSTNMLMRCCV